MDNQNSTLTPEAIDLAAKTASAHSAPRYENWAEVAQTILDRGCDVREAEAIMCSKWMDWAATHHGGDYGQVPASAVKYLLENPAEFFDLDDGSTIQSEVAALTKEHFEDEEPPSPKDSMNPRPFGDRKVD